MKKLVQSLFVLLLIASTVLAQDRRITGKVTAAEDGLPLPGVSVRVIGTNQGTQTDANGNFAINVPVTAKTIEISYIGFANQTLQIGTRSVFNVALDSDNKQLSEVVVTALGVSKAKSSIGYSYSVVGGEDLVKSGESNIIQGLAAKATGVQVVSSSGTPGASSKIVLRGVASFSGDNQPLIVIDGVPIDNDVNFIRAGDDPYNQFLAGVQVGNRALDINPEDVETVTVLKGPAAAALYGQAAGNGAIIYTTKKGKLGSGLGITYSSGFELQQINKLPKLQSKYGQGAGGVYDAATPNSWGANLEATGTPTYDNLDAFFQNGTNFNNNLAITSGGEKTTFRLSIGSTNNEGVVPFSTFDRYTTRLGSESKLSEKITVGGTLNYTNSNTSATQNGSNLAGVMLGLLRAPAEFNLSDYQFDDGTQKQFFGAYDNPFWSVRNNPYTEENNRLLGNVYTNITLNEMFSISWKTGLDSYGTNSRQVYAIGSNGDDNQSGLGELKYTNINYRSLYSDLLLKFNKKLSEDFSLSSLLGGNINYSQYSSSFSRGRELSIPGYLNLASASDLYASNAESYENNRALFLDATLDYKSIVFLTLTGREEWSSTFGKNSKGFFYPKADISYVFTNLFNGSKAVDYGKVRFAYSNVGISPGVYSNRAYYTSPIIADGMTNGFSFPYLGQAGFVISEQAVAPDFKPERNEGYEAGLEMKFFKDRLGFDFTYYQQTSSDLLISQPIDPTTGYSYYYNNIGKMRNTGIEFGLYGNIIKSKDFNWGTRVNWSKNQNEVLELAEGVTELSIGSAFAAPQSFAIVGQPFGVMYSQKFQRDASGQIVIDPANGLPRYESSLGNVGSTIPDWLMNVNNEFAYKNFSFSFLWDIRKGGKIWNGTYATLTQRGRADITSNRDETFIIDGVYSDGTKNTKTISGTQYYSSSYLGNANSEIAIEDGSWVRLRSVDLSYRFNQVSKAIQYIQLGMNLRNALLFTKYKGVDPETSLTGSSQNFAGYDYYNNPGTKSYSLNLRIGF